MPLIGLIDPSHDERAASEPGRYPHWTHIEELMAQAANPPGGPKWSPWTYELLHAAMDEWQERDYISSTMLTGGCARGKVIERKENFILGVDALYAALRGTQIHRTLEKSARPGSVAEARFWTSLYVPGAGDVEVSCSPDLLTDDTVWDYKVTENVPNFGYPYRHHTRQVNFNRFIVNHAERWRLQEGQDLPRHPSQWHFRHLALVYLGPKGPKVIETTKKQPFTFKNGKEGTKALPYVWTDEEVLEGFEDWGGLMDRLTGMVLALDAYPEWPAGLEDYPGFEGPPGWRCPGPPLCYLPNCTAKRWPDGLTWDIPRD